MIGTVITINGIEYRVIQRVKACKRCSKYIVENKRTKQRKVIDIPKG